MDGDRFDECVKRLGMAVHRRGLLAQVSLLAALGVPALDRLEATAGKRKKRRKKRKKRLGNPPGLDPLCNPTAKKKVAMCHVPPGNPGNAHVICIATSGCNGHDNDPGDCVCGTVPDGCLKDGLPFPECEEGRCRPNGDCPPAGQTCGGACDLDDFPCPEPPVGTVPNCRCQMQGLEGTCVDCPPARVCGLECCPAGQICCDGTCIDADSVCGDICGNVCADEETCCGTDCVPTSSLCPDCSTICEGAEVCCGNQCVVGQECCEDDQCQLICQTGACDGGTCEFTPVPPGEQGPFCNRPGEVCCEEAGTPVCCQGGEVCIASGCCTPLTCTDFPGLCGPQDDGCGGQTADCPCLLGQACGVDGICFFPACEPDSFDVACAGLQCGPASDGCGTDYTCGECGARQQCLTGVCKSSRKKRCTGKGLAGQPCNGKCKCKNGRRCNNGRCCESTGDGSVHCTANSDCCPGLMCARRRPGQHKVCMPRNAKIEDVSSPSPTPAPA